LKKNVLFTTGYADRQTKSKAVSNFTIYATFKLCGKHITGERKYVA
jgi:hypothetical protein